MKRISIGCAFFFLVWQPLLLAETRELPLEVQAKIDQALKLVYITRASFDRTVPFMERDRRVGVAATSFSKALDELADLIDNELAGKLKTAEGTTISAKLAVIALDRKARPELYKEIGDVYISTESLRPGLHVGAFPGPMSHHATETYRLPWEYFLLAPQPDPSQSTYYDSAIRALHFLRNDASIVTLVHSFRITCDEKIQPDTVIETRQTRLLTSLNGFPSDRGLRGMLECLSLVKEQHRHRVHPYSKWKPEDSIRNALTYKGNAERYAKWRQVIGAFPKDNLPADQRALLESVQAELERE